MITLMWLPKSKVSVRSDSSARSLTSHSQQQHMACSAATPNNVMLELGRGPCASPRPLRNESSPLMPSADPRSEGRLFNEECYAFGLPMLSDLDGWGLNSGLPTGVPASNTGFEAPGEQSAVCISSDVACQPTQQPPFPVSPSYPLGWPVAGYHFTQNPGTIDSTLTTSQDPTGWGVSCVPKLYSAIPQSPAGIDPAWLNASLGVTPHDSYSPFAECRGAAERDWTAGNGGPDLDSSTRTSEGASVMWAES